MFYVTWGMNTVSTVFEDPDQCPLCWTLSPCKVILTYTYAGLFWVFNFCTGKTFIVTCLHCGSQRGISHRTKWRVSNKLIPVRYRFSGLILLGFIALLILVNNQSQHNVHFPK
jgi:hypothetical protein